MLEPFCPVKQDLHKTNIYVSYRVTFYMHVSDIEIYSDI